MEEHFYILWPAAIIYVYRFNFHRAMIHLGLGLSSALRCSPGYFAWIISPAPISLGGGAFCRVLDCALLYRGNCFEWRYENGSYKKTRAMLTSKWAMWLGLALFVRSLALGLLPLPLDEVVRVSGVLLITCWIALNQKSLVVRVLEYEPLAYRGKISYGLCMWQGFILSTGPGRIEGQLLPIAPGFGLLLLCVVAPLSYRYFERPFLKMSARFRHIANPAHSEFSVLRRSALSLPPSFLETLIPANANVQMPDHIEPEVALPPL